MGNRVDCCFFIFHAGKLLRGFELIAAGMERLILWGTVFSFRVFAGICEHPRSDRSCCFGLRSVIGMLVDGGLGVWCLGGFLVCIWWFVGSIFWEFEREVHSEI